MTLLDLDPVQELLRRLRAELHSNFGGAPVCLARAPGTLEVMGGTTWYTGGLVLQMPLRVGAAVALQEREDRQVQAFSFNLLDDHRPFQFQVPLDVLAMPLADLGRELREPGRQWAGHLVGCLAVLHAAGHVDVKAMPRGLNLAVLSTVPAAGDGADQPAAEVATMNALVDHLDVSALREDPVALGMACGRVAREILATASGGVAQLVSQCGEAGELLRLRCQPQGLEKPVPLPPGTRLVGLVPGVDAGQGASSARVRAAAFIGHTMIVDAMRGLGGEAGKVMTADPTGGYLANLDAEDYKSLFRPILPEAITGAEFLDRHSSHGDPATAVEPGETYRVQAACDHHVLEQRRARRFAEFLEAGDDRSLRSAGRLMYASHKSARDNADVGSRAADEIVDLVKAREKSHLHGARLADDGKVAVLARDDDDARAAIDEIVRACGARSGLVPGLIDGSSPGAARTGTSRA